MEPRDIRIPSFRTFFLGSAGCAILLAVAGMLGSLFVWFDVSFGAYGLLFLWFGGLPLFFVGLVLGAGGVLVAPDRAAALRSIGTIVANVAIGAMIYALASTFQETANPGVQPTPASGRG